MTAVYYSDWPQPIIDDYAFKSSAALSITAFEGGITKQRRQLLNMKTLFTLTFRGSITEMYNIEYFLNTNIKHDIEFQLASNRVPGAQLSTHNVYVLDQGAVQRIGPNLYQLTIVVLDSEDKRA